MEPKIGAFYSNNEVRVRNLVLLVQLSWRVAPPLGVHYVEQSLTIDGETLPIFTNLKSLKTKTTSDHNLDADELLIQVQSDIKNYFQH